MDVRSDPLADASSVDVQLVDRATDSPTNIGLDAEPPAYSPPNTCRPMTNRGSGFFELSIIPGSGGNYSRTCEFNNRQLRVTGGNFGVSFELSADVSSQAGTYVLPRGSLRITESNGTTYYNSAQATCTLCLDAALVGNITCEEDALCASTSPTSCDEFEDRRKSIEAKFDC